MKKREKILVRLLELVATQSHTISLILIVLAALGLLSLPLLDRPIRFDEKGLLAGSSHPTIGSSAAALLPTASLIAASAASPATFKQPGAAAALVDELVRAGLTETQLTHATVALPCGTPRPLPRPCRCNNVHTRVRTTRGDGTESLALVTPVAFGPQLLGPGSGLAPPPSPSSPSSSSTSHTANQTADAAGLALLTGASLVLHLARGPGSAGGSGLEAGAADGGGGRWLVRDLLWVVPDLACGPQQCLDAWVRQYHSSGEPRGAGGRGRGSQQSGSQQSGSQQAGDLGEAAGAREVGTAAAQASVSGEGSGWPRGWGWGVRGGVIQQAVVLEAFAGASYDTPELLVIGHEGLLPKLDMFYLLRFYFNYPIHTALWGDQQVAAAYGAVAGWLQSLLPGHQALSRSTLDFLHRLLTGLHFTWHQALGQPSASHAAFKDSMVDAATVRLVKRGTERRSSHDASSLAVSLASSLELTLRSLNNLVERVHHSSFLYVLTGLDRYVSVERYVGPAVALAAVLQLQAAWSMLNVKQALSGAAAGRPGRLAPYAPLVWGGAAASTLVRVGVLSAGAAALRVLSCSPAGDLGYDPNDGAVCKGNAFRFPLWAVSAAGAVEDVLALPLSSPEGALAAGGLALAVAGGAAAAAVLAQRLVAAALTPTDDDLSGEATGRAGSGAGAAAGLKLLTWHAERTLLLTVTAVAMAALVCLNWAAALVAGAYLAPMALGQGWAASVRYAAVVGPQHEGPQREVTFARRRIKVWELVRTIIGASLRTAAWVAATPPLLLSSLDLLSAGKSAGGIPGLFEGTIAGAVCRLSATNYWYASVFGMAFWLFGVSSGEVI